jgi:flagellar hook-length control protein FliK
MTMRLEPPELGALRIQMSLNGPVVSARFVATTPEAHTLLERNIAALRSALESHGMQVERLSVHLHQPSGGSGPGAGGDGGGASQQEGGGQRHDAAGGESRGRHSGRQQAHAGEGWDFGSHVERAAGAARGDQAP